MNDEQTSQRMRAAAESITISETAQARHLEAISAALSEGEAVSLAGARSNRRRRAVASIVAAAVIAPAGLAAASEGSVPGDTLYPVKQLSERVLVLFDSEVIARHRLEEIEALEAIGRPDPDLYDDARAALTELGEGHPLWERLASSSMAADDEDRSRGEAPPPGRVTLRLPDGSEAAFMITHNGLVEVDPPTGWLVIELDDDVATLTSAHFEVDVQLLSDGTLNAEVTQRTPDDDDSPSSSVGEPAEPDDDESGATVTQPTTPSEDESDDDASTSDDVGGTGEADGGPGDDDPSDDG